jgi:hypothetical protein
MLPGAQRPSPGRPPASEAGGRGTARSEVSRRLGARWAHIARRRAQAPPAVSERAAGCLQALVTGCADTRAALLGTNGALPALVRCLGAATSPVRASP